MTSISRNLHTDKYVVNKYNNDIFDDIVNKYNNEHRRTTKRKPIDIKTSTCILAFMLKIIIKILNSTLVILLKY